MCTNISRRQSVIFRTREGFESRMFPIQDDMSPHLTAGYVYRECNCAFVKRRQCVVRSSVGIIVVCLAVISSAFRTGTNEKILLVHCASALRARGKQQSKRQKFDFCSNCGKWHHRRTLLLNGENGYKNNYGHSWQTGTVFYSPF